MRISQEKARIISKEMIEQKQKNIKDEFKKFTNILEQDILNELIPNEVIEFNKKYPGLCRTIGLFTVELNTDYCRAMFEFNNIPEIKDSRKKIKEWLCDECRVKKIIDKYTEYKKKLVETNTLQKQINCVLCELKYYSKIKSEMPEAYTLLCALDEKWGINNNQKNSLLQNSNLCDSVENIRAKLK